LPISRKIPRLIGDMRSPAKQSTEQALYAAALVALTRRAHSVFEMRTYLERRATEPDAAKSVLARLREQRLLDDARYAKEFARMRARIRTQGRYRIARELRARGVSDAHIEAALAETFAEVDEAATVRKVIARKIRAMRGPLDARKAASLYGSLLRRGFDGTVIRREMKPALRGASVSEELPDVQTTDEGG
jgi:regulatory protein